MSFSISLTDLKLIDCLSHMSERDMMNPANEKVMLKYLHMFGMDCNYGYAYVPSTHRNMQNKVVTSFRVCGDIRCDASFRNGPYASLTDRLVMTAYTDISLTEELGKLVGLSRAYGGMDSEESMKEFMLDSQLEPEWQSKEENLWRMAAMCESIRGPYFTEAGSLKTKEDYQLWFEQSKGQ
jgi:hypothetical protein